MNDQQCTPFVDNAKELLKALFHVGYPRTDKRGWLGAVGHEGKNVIVELWRKARGQCPEQDEHGKL